MFESTQAISLDVPPKQQASRATPAGILDPTRADLQATVLKLRAIGASFVPVRGSHASDYESAKHPIGKWAQYQTRRPHDHEVKTWLANKKLGGWALVNGDGSGFFSVDIDTPEAERAFANDLPNFPLTYTERTPKGGLHLIYRAPDRVSIGGLIPVPEFGEFRGNGGVTVIAPTTYRGRGWRVERGSLDTIAQLTVEQFEALRTFYLRRKPAPEETRTIASVPTLRPPRKASPSSSEVRRINQRVVDEIEARLLALGGTYNSNESGRWVNCSSPFRQEKHISHGFNLDTRYGWDFTGRSYCAVDYCRLFGINVNDYGGLYEPDGTADLRLNLDEGSTIVEVTGELVPSAWFATGLPDAWRAAIRQFMPPTAALIVECLTEAARHGYIDPHGFTLADVMTARDTLGYAFSERTARGLLSSLSGVFWQDLAIEKKHGIAMAKFCRNSTGRPAAAYGLMSIEDAKRGLLEWALPRLYEQFHPAGESEEVLAKPTPRMLESAIAGEGERTAALDKLLQPAYTKQNRTEQRAARRALKAYNDLAFSLDNHTSTSLPAWSIKKTADYDAARLRGMVESTDESQLSYKEWALKLGVDRSAVAPLLKRAGIENERQTVKHPLTGTDDPVYAIQRRAAEIGGHPFLVTATHPDGKTATLDCERAAPALVRSFVRSQRAKGAAVEAEYRVASRQRVATEGQPPAPEPKPAPVPTTELKATNTTPRDSAPAPHYGPTYNPVWLAAQFRLAMKLLGWAKTDDGRFVTPYGEPVPEDASAADLLTFLLEAADPPEVLAPPIDDGMVDMIRMAQDLGATVRRVDVKAVTL